MVVKNMTMVLLCRDNFWFYDDGFSACNVCVVWRACACVRALPCRRCATVLFPSPHRPAPRVAGKKMQNKEDLKEMADIQSG